MNAVLAEAEAHIRVADAGVELELRRRTAELELAEKERRLAEANEDHKDKKRQAKHAKRARKRLVKRRARRVARAKFRARFQAALAGRLILLLVASAVATAWHGQYGYLHAPTEAGGQGLTLVFAATGATALELLGLAMGAIVRNAGDQYRDRAIRARLVMWAVIGFSAWSNLAHNGPVLAALSILGPTAWEIHEWWNRRAKLHAAGVLAVRPVRPRFPLDQVILFPRWTLAAYRVAVRDRIEDTDRALSVAAAEQAARKRHRALGRQAKKWGPVVRELIDAERKAATDRAARVAAEAEAALGAAALLLGPEPLRQAADQASESDRAEATERGGHRPGGGLFGSRFGRHRTATDQQQPESVNAADEQTTESTGDGRQGATKQCTTGAAGQATEAINAASDRRPAGTGQATEPGGGRRRTGSRGARGRGTTETTDVDVSDLLPAALEVAAELGDRLSRDALLKGLRGRGHTVGGRRRAAIYKIVRDDRGRGASDDRTGQPRAA